MKDLSYEVYFITMRSAIHWAINNRRMLSTRYLSEGCEPRGLGKTSVLDRTVYGTYFRRKCFLLNRYFLKPCSVPNIKARDKDTVLVQQRIPKY